MTIKILDSFFYIIPTKILGNVYVTILLNISKILYRPRITDKVEETYSETRQGTRKRRDYRHGKGLDVCVESLTSGTSDTTLLGPLLPREKVRPDLG